MDKQPLIDYLKQKPEASFYNYFPPDKEIEIAYLKKANEIFKICTQMILEALPDDEKISEVAFEVSNILNGAFENGANWMKTKIKEL